ncbi:hypothetical protein BGZ65_009299 [Modicella reniformis]|uniref:Uncharacterized protein n=1 Tax=Modicella reniformis TaxID=1440133 RepID=A0A9P6M1Z4_9FUNG|nr:hypothetical protein BGZ65_009299 [Modicella reniformis]
MPLQPDVSSIISLMVSLLAISLMSVLFGRKTAGTSVSNINYARGLVIALYMVSWGFTTIAAVLSSTNNGNIISCTISIFVCLSLYAASKIIIYLFLIEKVHVVSAVTSRRKDSLLYRINILLLTPYTFILILMIFNRVAEVKEEGKCYIGLKPTASITLILYDIFISAWLTILFIRPLMSTTSALQGPSKGKLRQVARRTLIGSIIALILSSANVFTLVFYKGYEDSILCLLSCTLDVTLNACTIHWVTSRAKGHQTTDKGSRAATGASNAMSGSVMPTSEKHYAPTESHISVTVESYSESH